MIMLNCRNDREETEARSDRWIETARYFLRINESNIWRNSECYIMNSHAPKSRPSEEVAGKLEMVEARKKKDSSKLHQSDDSVRGERQVPGEE
jgi:hypothetical protein